MTKAWKVLIRDKHPGHFACALEVLRAAAEEHGRTKFAVSPEFAPIVGTKSLEWFLSYEDVTDCDIELVLPPEPPNSLLCMLEYTQQMENATGLPLIQRIKKPQLPKGKPDPELVRRVGRGGKPLAILDCTPIAGSIVTQRFWERVCEVLGPVYKLVNVGSLEIVGAINLTSPGEVVSVFRTFPQARFLMSDSPTAMLAWAFEAEDVVQILNPAYETKARYRMPVCEARKHSNDPSLLNWVRDEF